MNYVIVYKDELYHHGVKGMKWGVRKVDYNTSGLRSHNIYDRIDDLERQERKSYRANRKSYRSAAAARHTTKPDWIEPKRDARNLQLSIQDSIIGDSYVRLHIFR